MRAIAKKVGVTVRKDHDIAGRQLYARTILKFGVGAPFREEMEDDQVPRERREIWRYRGRLG